MIRLLASVGCTVLLGAAVLVQAPAKSEGTCRVTLRLVDSATRRPIAGLVRFTDANKAVQHPPELLNRGLGLKPEQAISEWCVVTASPTAVSLPRMKISLSAISGLETERAETAIDLTGRETAEVEVPLVRFSDLREQGLVSGNTHLHLMKISREEADRYLTEVPRADDLDILFLSYLERAEADREYTSNRYTREDLAKLSKTGTELGNGEEHRHNFGPGDEGYGHVMLLDLKELVLPVSIGPGIMKLGTDGLPIQRGLELARKSGATVVWCHNHWGMENAPNWVTGRLDAQNIFDGGEHGSYKDSFYQYLNAGLRVPFSTGTDWFLYDFSRVYVPLDGPPTPRKWLESLKAGRSFITNGPLLELRVGGQPIGSTVELKAPASVALKAAAAGRIDFQRLEVIRNGQVVAKSPAEKKDGHFEARLETELKVDGPCWIALRTPPPPVMKDPTLQEPVPLNELGEKLFSHTSPVYVRLDGRDVFDPAAARELVARVERNRGAIPRLAKFADDEERQRVLAVHDEALRVLRGWLAR